MVFNLNSFSVMLRHCICLSQCMKNLVVVFLFSLSAHELQAQTSGTVLPAIIEGDDTIPVVNLPPANISDFSTKPEDLQAYYRLRFNVIKVYPYARLAAIKIKEMNDHMSTLKTDREKRKYQNKFEDQLKEEFEEQMKKLSVNQGKVLVKLVQRETGQSAFALVKDMKGGVNAFIWQNAAKLWGNDLKAPYEPNGADRTIESIVQQIERGEIAGN